MMLKNHLSKEPGLSDLLNYAHFIDDGIIINKDGAYLTVFKYQGPDINSQSKAELDALCNSFNRMVTGLQDGWMLHLDVLRIPNFSYPTNNHFPEIVSSIMDEERKKSYEEGSHFENLYFLTFVWKFPAPFVKTAKHWFVEGIEKDNNELNLTQLLKTFKETVDRSLGILSSHFSFQKLNNAEILCFLNSCITGEILPMSVPPEGTFLDVALSRRSLTAGFIPKIHNQYIYVLSIMGFLNEETTPGLLEHLSTYPLIYRWSNRFIPLSEDTAEKEIKKYQRNWNNKVKGLIGIIKELFSGKPSETINFDALEMSKELDSALTLNANQSTRFGYWSSEIVIFNEDLSILNEAEKNIRRFLEHQGFTCKREDINSLDGWLGTIPGHGSSNVRRLFLNSMNLAHVLPLNSVWSGVKLSSQSLLPKNAPPVFVAKTAGKTPFHYHMDVSDVGHSIILGPTGSGKSTFLGLLISQFLRYSDAQIYVFDKDESHKALTYALSGKHYDFGDVDEISFAPLSDLSTETKKVRAEQFIEDLVRLQNITITPDVRTSIHKAIESLSLIEDNKNSNLTVFKSEVQNEEVRSAIQYYTLEGQLKLLDAKSDSIEESHLQTFEMNWLLSQRQEIYLPILRYIFDKIEAKLEENNGKFPTLIILEEAWFYISHDVFAKKLKDWLKTLRKKNARVVFATQSLADLYDPSTQSLTSVTAAILESCPTKVFLPNKSMDMEVKNLYQKIGLTSRQVEIIQNAQPKHDYYIVTPEGNRLIDLDWVSGKSLSHSFIGLSKVQSSALINLIEEGEEWLYKWLLQNNQNEWVQIIKDLKNKRNVA